MSVPIDECEELICDALDSSDESSFEYVKDDSKEFLILNTSDFFADPPPDSNDFSLKKEKGRGDLTLFFFDLFFFLYYVTEFVLLYFFFLLDFFFRHSLYSSPPSINPFCSRLPISYTGHRSLVT